MELTSQIERKIVIIEIELDQRALDIFKVLWKHLVWHLIKIVRIVNCFMTVSLILEIEHWLKLLIGQVTIIKDAAIISTEPCA